MDDSNSDWDSLPHEEQGKKSLKIHTVRPRDTRPQAALTLTMHVFEYGPKRFEMHEFM